MKNYISLINEVITLYSAKKMDEGDYDTILSLNKMRYDIYKSDNKCLDVIKDFIKDLNKYSKYLNENNFFTDTYDEKEIYGLTIKMIDDVCNSDNDIPTAVFVGGQPGSGKSEIVNKTIKEFYEQDKKIVLLDLDIYRALYKNYFSLLVNSSNLYSNITNNAIGKLAEKLSEYVILKKYNFIFEGTMGKYPYTLELLKKSSEKYNVVVKIMAVCREESILSIFERYIESKKIINVGRLTTIDDHDVRYFNLLEVASIIENEGIEVEVYQRINSSIDMIYKSSNKNKYKSVEHAIILARENSYNDCIVSFNNRIDNIFKEFKELGEIDKYKDELEKLKFMKK